MGVVNFCAAISFAAQSASGEIITTLVLLEPLGDSLKSSSWLVVPKVHIKKSTTVFSRNRQFCL